MTGLSITLRDRAVLGSDVLTLPSPYVDRLAGVVRLGLGDDVLWAVLPHNVADLLRLSGSAP